MKFTPEDFLPKDYNTEFLKATTMNFRIECAEMANAKLKEWLDAAPVMYGMHHDDECAIEEWDVMKGINDTHTAKLVCIEKIKK